MHCDGMTMARDENTPSFRSESMKKGEKSDLMDLERKLCGRRVFEVIQL
jgi:hypothetical protein